MNNKLLILSKLLKKRGHNLYAAKIKNLSKIAVPLEGIVRLPNVERTTKVDEYGDEVPAWQSIGPSRRDDIRLDKTENWYGALEALGTNVILIPFNKNELTSDDVEALSEIFGYNISNYEGLVNRASNIGNSEAGDLEILKENFPSLASEIDSLLNEKNLDEQDVTFVLYNEATPPPREFSSPEKSPRYMGHDFGHIEIDYGEDYEFKGILFDHLAALCELYIDEEREENANLYDKGDEPSLYNAMLYAYEGNSGSEYIEDEQWEEIIGDIFPTYSDYDDQIYDVFADALQGTLDAEAPKVIYYRTKEKDGRFELKDPAAAKRILTSLMEDLNKYVGGKGGPLSWAEGQVIFYDFL